jgi:hypothetical protein
MYAEWPLSLCKGRSSQEPLDALLSTLRSQQGGYGENE